MCRSAALSELVDMVLFVFSSSKAHVYLTTLSVAHILYLQTSGNTQAISEGTEKNHEECWLPRLLVHIRTRGLPKRKYKQLFGEVHFFLFYNFCYICSYRVAEKSRDPRCLTCYL